MSKSLILCNGAVYPLNGIVAKTEAVSIRNGQILKMGTTDRVKESIPAPEETIDLRNRAVVPGFTDSLGQIGFEALMRATLDVSRMRMLPEIFAVVEQRIKQTPPGEWVVGYGWNKNQWGWSRFPHRADLDLVSPHHPVALFSADHRVVWLNTQGLQRAEIRRTTADPPGGEIERDPVTGSATGILKEAAVDLTAPHIPDPDPAAIEAVFPEIFQSYLLRGVTAVESFETFAGLAALRRFHARSPIPIQVTCHVRYEDRAEIESEGLATGKWSEGVRMGGVFIQVDGTLLSQTARLQTPYADDWNKFGLSVRSAEGLLEAGEWCMGRDLAPIFVASGDAAVHEVLTALAELGKRKRGLRPVVVHGDLVLNSDWLPISRLHPTLCVNPRRIRSEAEVGRVFWGDRWKSALDLGRWKSHGAPITFGSGEPFHHWSPMECVWAAVSPREGRDAKSGFPMDAAFAAMARSVMQVLDDSEEGFLGAGKPADLVVLSEDPFRIPPDEVRGVEIDHVIRRGQVTDAVSGGAEADGAES